MTPAFECKKCGSRDFGMWTSATSGRTHRYCRPCRRVRASAYSTRRKATGECHTRSEWLAKLANFDHCPICERAWGAISPRPDRRYRSVWTKDHIIPLVRGGTDHINNIQPACYQCNSGKCGGRELKKRGALINAGMHFTAPFVSLALNGIPPGHTPSRGQTRG